MAANQPAGNEIRVIFVEPKYQINLGYAARVLKNFGIGSLHVVKPRCSITGKEAIKYSKHAREILEGATVYKDLKSALKGSDITVGTTGIWRKGDAAFSNVYTPGELGRVIGNRRSVSLLIGRDDIGLTKEELMMCDATVYIPTNPDYPVMNISHALAVLLYELESGRFATLHWIEAARATAADRKRTALLFEMFVNSKPNIRNKAAVSSAFSHIINRAYPTKGELSALAVAIAPSRKTKNKIKVRKRK